MEYLIVLMEGIITFISPCVLPMLPIYIAYFAGDDGEVRKRRALKNSIGFVIGFTIVFTLLGALAGSMGSLMRKYYSIFNVIGGIVLIAFGLNYMGVFKISWLQNSKKLDFSIKSFKFLSSMVFGMIFAIGWTPCVGTFLGSALMLAANSKTMFKGILMLLIYSLGLGIPFIISSILLEEMRNGLNFIKKNYKMINRVSGGFLVLVGAMMMFGYLNKLLGILSFR